MKKTILVTTVKDTLQIVNIETISKMYSYVDENTEEVITRIDSDDFEKGYLLSKTPISEIINMIGDEKTEFITVIGVNKVFETYLRKSDIKEIYQKKDGTVKITSKDLVTKSGIYSQFINVQNSIESINRELNNKPKKEEVKKSSFFGLKKEIAS